MTTFCVPITIYLDAPDQEGAEAEAEFLLDTLIDHATSLVALESERPKESAAPRDGSA